MDLYNRVQQQMKKSYTYLADTYDVWLLEYVLHPDRIIEVSLPVTMDDGSVQTFVWYRSQHSNARGPYKGGIRFHQNVSKDEVMSLSAWMSLKTAVVDIPLGWGKWWIIVNPKELSDGELQRLSRAYAKAIAPQIWPEKDIPAPDVNTNSRIMAWMRDTYETVTQSFAPWVITGKPLQLWGSQWRDIATAQWWLFVLQTYLAHNQDSLAGKTIAIQWAGNAWLTFARLATEAWARVIAITDSRGWVRDHDWLTPDRLASLKAQKKSVSDYGADTLSNDDILTLDVDILVPAALENVITTDNAWDVQASIILELANGPLHSDASPILANNNIVVIPDILANAGWVTVSYFEQVQNNNNYYRDREEVMEKLSVIMTKATTDVLAYADRYDVTLREWAYILALQRILGAYHHII